MALLALSDDALGVVFEGLRNTLDLRVTLALSSACHGLWAPTKVLQQQRRRQRPQPMTGAAEGQDDARVERVAQPLEDDAQRIVAQGKERHRGARAARWGVNARTSGAQGK